MTMLLTSQTKKLISSSISSGRLAEIEIRLRNERQRRIDENKLAHYVPYPKQKEFHNLGAELLSERLFMAGNQLGKTWAGAFETAYHLTGRYPDWWEGAVFESPTKFWVAGVTGESTRDNPQRLLIGPPQLESAWGTGAIPKDALKDWERARGVADLLDSSIVKWGGGGDVQQGESLVLFKAYEKGRLKWQGDTIDGLWNDEEPPEDIYSEGRTRTQRGQRGTFVYTTFTPLLGMSNVVRQFLSEAQVKGMKTA